MKKTEILKAYNFRHACKSYNPTQDISQEDFNFIMETARLSPSSFGMEPWKILVIQNKELREKLRLNETWGAQTQLPTASHFIIILGMKAPLVKAGSTYLNKIQKDYLKRPDEVIEIINKHYKVFQDNDFQLNTEREIFDWSSRQAYIALGNMMTSAAMIGIDSCPIEGFNIDKTERFLCDELNIDTNLYGPSVMASFGYRVNEQPEKTRRPIDMVVQTFD